MKKIPFVFVLAVVALIVNGCATGTGPMSAASGAGDGTGITLIEMKMPGSVRSTEKFPIIIKYRSSFSIEELEKIIDYVEINFEEKLKKPHKGNASILPGGEIKTEGPSFALGKPKSVVVSCRLLLKDGNKTNSVSGLIDVSR